MTEEQQPQGGSFAQALTQALQNQNLTLERIVAHLRASGNPVSTATLSYWKNGRSVPTRSKSLKVLSELEYLLKVEPGTLSSALPDSLKWDPRVMLPESNSVEDLLSQIGLSLARSWSRLSARERLIVLRDRTEGDQMSQSTMRAEIDNAQFFPVVMHQDTAKNMAPTISTGFGCEIADVRCIPEENLTVASLQLPRPVPRGTIVSVEWTIHWRQTEEEAFRLERSLPNATRLLSLEVYFEGEAPKSFSRYVRPTFGGYKGLPLESLQHQGQWVQSVITDATPGVHGITWDW